MKAKWVSVFLLSLAGVLVSLSPVQLALPGGAQSLGSTGYLPTPRPFEVCDTCEPNASLSKACGPLAPNTNYRYPARCTTAPDDDLYYVDVQIPGAVTLDLANIPAGADYNVYLYDQNGTLICYSARPGNGDEHVTCNVSQPGRYYPRVYPVTGCNDSALYTLRVAYPTPPPPPVPTPISPPPCNVHIDDFPDQNSDNDLGGSSTWGSNPSGCGNFSATYTGSVLRLSYNFTSTTCIARYTTTFALDASPYETLAFEISGEGQQNNKQELLNTIVGLSDQSGRTMTVTVGNFANRVATDTWQGVAVPLAAFATKVDTSRLSALFVEFSDAQGANAGPVYLDSLRLERPRAPLMVDNFNDRSDPNALGGASNTFLTGTATISTAYTTSGAYDASTASYVITYTAPLFEYSVWQTALSGLDVSEYAFLSFYIKGTNGGEKVNLYLADSSGVRRFVDVETYTPVGTSWRHVKVPLKAYTSQGVNLTALSWMQFAFEYEPMTGTIFLDDLRFEAVPLLIDNFCDNEASNNTNKGTNNSLNGETGTFNSVPICPATLAPTLANSTSLRLDYDVTAGNQCYAGYSSKMPLDLNSYRSLTVKVRGETCGEVAAVSTETDPAAPDKIKLNDYLLDGITDEWQEATIPLAAYSVITDWTRSKAFVVAFEAWRGASKGTTYWDDIAYKTTCSPLWVDNFNDEDSLNALVGNSWIISDTPAMTMTTSIIQAHGDAGAGLALNYSVPAGRWAGWTTELRDVNLSGYEWLIFNVKTDPGGASPHIYLERMDGSVVTRPFVKLDSYVSLSTEWQTVFIPLRHFTGLDLTRIRYLQVIVENQTANVQGTLYLDNIHFLPSASCSQVDPNDIFLPMMAKRFTPPTLIGPMWDFESDSQGWTHQTYTDTQAIVAVERSSFRSISGTASLAMVFDLVGGDANRSKGEAFVDVSNNPPSPGRTSLNLACKPVSCWVYVPTCGLGDAAAPNQVQLFVKNADGTSEYGSPISVVRNQWFQVNLRPSTLAPCDDCMDPGFNPTAIDQLGIKFAAGSGQTRYRGKVYVDVCGWQEIDPLASSTAQVCAPGSISALP